ncbi:hypothetical protein SAMN05660330_00233 [Desulforhopalus singaporensis]|uniref:HTH IS21-type domain-containing protein n=1 Tax=Desulforhopalus singaporensis TaxID=91360 RepID=A0A1H0JKX2_9BACT|nr:hypothetical protein SAMN05660330_00233 [Desulforhopalus singaporensis]
MAWDKSISRKLGLSRNTVRKFILSGATEHTYQRTIQPQPLLDEYVSQLEKLLDEDWERPGKRKITARRLFELLRTEGYAGSYDCVQRFTKKWRRGKGKQSSGAFVPLKFPPRS